jgi:integrase
MVHNSTKYLLLRGSTFHFRWRVPAELRSTFGSTELRRSLRTTDHLQAGIRVGRFVMAVGAIQSIQRAFLMGEVAHDDYIRISIKHWKAMSDTIKTEQIVFFSNGALKSVDCDGDYEKEQEIAKALLQAKSDSDIALQRVINERPVPAERQAVLKMPDSGMLFSELFEKFMTQKTDLDERATEGKKPLSEKIQKDYHSYFNRLLSIMGDQSINSITPKILRKAILRCRCLPRGNLRAYKNIPVVQLLEMDIEEDDRLSDGTVIEFKKMVQGMFRYAVDSDIDLDSSPANALNLKLEEPAHYAPYSDLEVQLLLRASWEERELWKKWLPTLAAYTGCRRSELVQLRKQDIKFDSDSGRNYLLITSEAGKAKSKSANREIPMHAKLVELGFLDFVKSVDDVRLFGSLNPEAVTHWFVRLRDRLNIERCDNFGSRRVFHSFRHGFVTKSRGADNSLENVQQVVGHQKVNASITDIYSHRQPLKVVLDVVDKVHYD